LEITPRSQYESQQSNQAGQMTEQIPAIPQGSVEQLVARLEQDLRLSGLSPGDGYLTAEQVGMKFSVSPAMANRAMKVMAQRGLLVRHRSRGSFVGHAFTADPAGKAPAVVIVLLPESRASTFEYGVVMRALRNAYPGASVQFCELPEGAELQTAKAVVAGQPGAGVLAVDCPYPVQRWLCDSLARAVVVGSTFRDLGRLPSVNIDMRQAGRLLAQYMIGRGHRKLVLFTTQSWQPGDNLFHEGITDAMAAANLPDMALRVRALPADERTIQAEAQALIHLENPPTGFICWRVFFGRAVYQGISESCPAEIAALATSVEEANCPGVKTCMVVDGAQALYTRAGQVLHGLARNGSPHASEILLPVEIVDRQTGPGLRLENP
jgi:DNA-binding LacI/PurR family transcriptional regulator